MNYNILFWVFTKLIWVKCLPSEPPSQNDTHENYWCCILSYFILPACYMFESSGKMLSRYTIRFYSQINPDFLKWSHDRKKCNILIQLHNSIVVLFTCVHFRVSLRMQTTFMHFSMRKILFDINTHESIMNTYIRNILCIQKESRLYYILITVSLK